MLNLGQINFDNTGLVPNTVPKVTAAAGTQTLSPSGLTDDGTTLSYKGTPISGGGTGVTGSGTANKIPKFATTTSVGDSAIDDGVTTAGVVTSTKPVAAPSFQGLTFYSAAGTPLPAASTALKGTIACVSDATTPTVGAAYVSGGAVFCLVVCTGAGWVTV